MSNPTRDYTWSSPGGLYVVPDDFKRQFLAEFPDYRIRWSLRESCWHIEQPCGRGALPPIRIDPYDDSLIRACDGYWRVMAIQPGDRMACPAMVTRFPRQTCGWTLKVPHHRTAEAVCAVCRTKGRDGRTFAAYYPFGESLLDALRETDPLTRGVTKVDGKLRVAASVSADAQNQARLREAERKQRDATTSIDAVDYRWLTGIGSTSGLRRQIDDKTFT